MSLLSNAKIGDVLVTATENIGHSPEFWAKKATSRIVSVGKQSHPVIAEQAEVFQDSVYHVVSFHIKEAIKSDRTTLIAELEQQGQKEMTDILRRL